MAYKKAVTVGSDPSTESVVRLLSSILDEFQQQVQSKTPKPLEGKALEAVAQFKVIDAALALRPTIKLTAVPTQFGTNGGTVKLTWFSTDAETVSIDQGVGEVTPPAGGSIEVSVLVTTTFTATAKGPCSSATASATVTVANEP